MKKEDPIKLRALLNEIIEGPYGWVAESMMQIYCDDDEIDYKEAEKYLDQNYKHAIIEDEKCWILRAGLSESYIQEHYYD